MSLTFSCMQRSQFKGEKDTLALFDWEDDKINAIGWLDSKKEALMKNMAQKEGFKGKPGELLVHYPENAQPSCRLVIVGIGKKKEADLKHLRLATAKAVRAALKQSDTLWIGIPDWPERAAHAEALAQVITEAAMLAQYKYLKHKTDTEETKQDRTLKNVILVAEKPGDLPRIEAGVKKGKAAGEAANLVRDLVNEPPSMKRPLTLAKLAKTFATRQLKVRVYNKSELERMGMHALLGVNRGSDHEPAFVHLVYKPSGTPKKRIGLVGKGITFDSGGLNIKVGTGMTTMKLDMAGGATVFAVLKACEKLNLACEVQGFVPLTENMPGGDAYKPGDVVKALNGKTIEILNTDAEGRVILADALAFAAKQDLDAIIDLATLTGAVLVALGDQITGLMSNNDRVATDFENAAKAAGEKVWRLPLDKDYKERYKSKVADIANVSFQGGTPGTIGAGLFLQEFVDNKPWVHLDIAGTAWADNDSTMGPSGGTGAMVRTLLEYLTN
ncbi:MAG: leucyl aminopeptidase [Elusimicrobiota bacterium]